MNRFQVLNRQQEIRGRYLIEASAGTGKTFSIENLVVRLLIEEPPLHLHHILVVTFTKAATKDLKTRIHRTLLKSAGLLRGYLKDPSGELSAPDYLIPLFEKGPEQVQRTLRSLETALSCYDNAQIYTIHSFCARMLQDNALEAHASIAGTEPAAGDIEKRIRGLIRDFFRSDQMQQLYSDAQLKQLLKSHKSDIELLEKGIAETIQRGIDIVPLPAFPALHQEFRNTMRFLKSEHALCGAHILEDCTARAPNYNKLLDRSGKIKPDIYQKVARFAQLFDQEDWSPEDLNALIEDQLSILQAFSPENLKKKQKAGAPLHYPAFDALIAAHLTPYVDTNSVFARLCRDCKEIVRTHQQAEQWLSFDDYLSAMNQALDHPAFWENVHTRYRAAIIDEFQDTDPLQWEIFQKLFLRDESPQAHLYLVGDPKQSIYAFRQADIYTYLDAARKMGDSARVSLDTNYRSQPALIDALNHLFCEETCPGFLNLPKENTILAYPQVKPSGAIPERKFSDSRGALHFFIADRSEETGYSLETSESECFLPFIVQEIQHLTRNDRFPYSSFAILVADRFQAERTRNFLRKWNIPVAMQKPTSLADSPAVHAFQELLEAVLYPRDLNLLKIALGGKILRWNQYEIAALDDLAALEPVLYKMHALREALLEKGLSGFLPQLLDSNWKEDCLNVYQRLLAEKDGEDLLQDLFCIAEFLLEQEEICCTHPEASIKRLDQIKSGTLGEEHGVKRIEDPTKNAVKILTVHASKGLEFDIVFTLGLLKRHKPQPSVVPTEQEGKKILIPVIDAQSPPCQLYFQELAAEKMRQLYVAMTRAKYRLYNPLLLSPPAGNDQASAIELFISRLKKPAEWGFIDFLGRLPPGLSITYTHYPTTPIVLSNTGGISPPAIQPPPPIAIPGTARFIHSFTSLNAARHAATLSEGLVSPKDFQEPIRSPHTLPSGSDTGTLLHLCLEKLEFGRYKDARSPAALHDSIRPLIAGSPYESWLEVVAAMVYNALHIPLRGEFRLSDVSADRCLKEAEFLCPSLTRDYPGYTKGFIDLFFEYEGKYYLLDWKSNWLGPNLNHYARAHLHTCMEENGYFLQAHLYTEALKRYLRIVDPRPFDAIFGGIFYVFLRGLEIEQGPDFGIFDFKAALK